MYIREQPPRDRYSQQYSSPYGSPFETPSYGGQPMLPPLSNANYPSHNFHKPAPSNPQPNKQQYDIPVSNNKSFIDGFDNNTSGLMQ